MTLRRACLGLLLAGLLTGTNANAAPGPASPAGRRPNVIVILTDDQGYGDLGCHGHPVLQTPHLDRLHREGVRFTDFHVSPTCAPTRSALLTGRHEFRNGITHTILERERLAPGAITLAEILRTAGYTTGIFGKWHLGDEAAYRPDRRGFDEVFIHGGGGIGQTYPGSCGDAPGNTYFNPAILHNGRFERTEGYCTDVFFRQALQWIGEARDRKKPFLAWIAPNAPHAPLQVRPEDEARYTGRVTNAATAKFLGMISNIDDNVGRLLARLTELGLERDTLVIFMNDNGTAGGLQAGYNAGMRGGKGTAFLGGTRAASFWRWPGTLTPADCPALTAHLDVLPTLAEIAGATLTPAARHQFEGRSLVPLLENPAAPWPDRTLVTHLGRWPKHADPADARYNQCSIRTPRWHLVSANGGTRPKWLLFDVTRDYGEQTNLAEREPAVVRDLAARFDAWWESVQPALINEQAPGPRVNPFKELYWQQFGGGPSPEDLRRMDPSAPAADTGPAKPTATIGVTADGRGFALQPWGRPFTPWGFNYDHDEKGRLLEDYWETEWDRVEEDFRDMQDMGANVVRIHLQLGRFMEAPDKANGTSLGRLRRLLDLAARTGLRLNLTGLGCYDKAAVPAWYAGLSEKERWQAQAAFWEAVARTCAASPRSLFCYDLMNEPVVAGAPRTAGDWLGQPFAGKHFVQFITLDPAGRERSAIARAWIQALTSAIRRHDPRTLITVGLVDWSLDRPGLQSGFDPARIAPDLDFLSVHLYPKAGQMEAALDTLRGFAVGKPVVIEETFPLSAPMPEFTRFLEASRPPAAGWFGFYWGRPPAKLPAATDLPGVLTRAWLEYFQDQPQPRVPGHQTRRLEGWTVLVNEQLLAREKETTELGLRLLGEQLRVLRNIIPAAPLAHLRTVPLWISPEYKGVRPTAEYHPGAGWLRDHGRNPAMVGAVEFTDVRSLPQEVKRMPMLVLHELAHAYHDQVLGYDHPGIRDAARRARESGRYDRVERVFADGSRKTDRAYALTNPQEYFAECTEAFFGRNDFYPFTREELRREDPGMHRLLERIWLAK